MFIIFLINIILLLFFVRKNNKAYTFLVLLTCITFLMQFLVGRSFEYKSLKTLFNVCFICINIFLIIKPWSHACISSVDNLSLHFLYHFKKTLYFVLFINLILNSIILILVLIYLPDIASFKAESAYLNLYDQIPYFANIFRYAYTTQHTGYLGIPIFYFYLGTLKRKEAFIAFLFSSSSLLSGFAFYSRAQIFTYTVLFIIYFFLIKKTLPNFITLKVSRFIKYSSITIAVLFLSITYIRFSAMDYYGDRIPNKSIVQDPIVYSLFDYASQSYSNGLYQLDIFTTDKSLGGEQFFRDIYQILNFFGFVHWDAKDSQEVIDRAYDYDGGAFNGYTTPLVFNFGYIFSFLISFSYFLYTKSLLKKKASISLDVLFLLILLLIIPTVSIFYNGYTLLYFPLLLFVFSKFTYKLKYILKQS